VVYSSDLGQWYTSVILISGNGVMEVSLIHLKTTSSLFQPNYTKEINSKEKNTVAISAHNRK
jgi:hypothetical protein